MNEENKSSKNSQQEIAMMRTLVNFLPEEKRTAIFEQHLDREAQLFIQKVHTLSEVFGMGAKFRLGSSIQNIFYDLDLTTSEHESAEAAQDYGNKRKEELSA